MGIRTTTPLAMMAIGAVACALLAACAEAAAPPPHPAAATPSAPSPSAPSVSGSDFTVGCDGLSDLAHAFPAADALTEVSDMTSVVWPGKEAIRQARGIGCEWSGEGGVAISALSDAGDDYTAARQAAEAQATSNWVPHTDNAAGDEGLTTCYDHGNGRSTCAWSILASGNWIVVKARNLPLDLIPPPDPPSGWSQQPLPDPGGAAQATVNAIVSAVVAASEQAATAESHPAADCHAVLDAGRTESALGLPAGAVVVSAARNGVETAAHVASTAGYSLPYFAAARMGWTRCAAVAPGWQIDVTVAPGAAEIFEPARTVGADGATHAYGEDGEVYQYAEFRGDDVRAIVVVSTAGSLEGDPSTVLAAILG